MEGEGGRSEDQYQMSHFTNTNCRRKGGELSLEGVWGKVFNRAAVLGLHHGGGDTPKDKFETQNIVHEQKNMIPLKTLQDNRDGGYQEDASNTRKSEKSERVELNKQRKKVKNTQKGTA